jgi:Na+/proline symporter
LVHPAQRLIIMTKEVGTKLTNPALVLLALILFAIIPFFFGAVILAVLTLFDDETQPQLEPDEED